MARLRIAPRQITLRDVVDATHQYDTAKGALDFSHMVDLYHASEHGRRARLHRPIYPARWQTALAVLVILGIWFLLFWAAGSFDRG
jgi:hypothetical protein